MELAQEQVDRLEIYLSLLQTWNRKINLTSITAPAEVVELHFLDSLAAVNLLRSARTLIDVGAGGGFPGAVLAIALPSLQVTAIDGVAKKVAFLQTLRRTVAPNLVPRHQRLEAVEETFEAAISRATWDPPLWVAQGVRLVREGGRIIAMQTGGAPVVEAPIGFEAEPAVLYSVGGAERRLQAFRRRVTAPPQGG